MNGKGEPSAGNGKNGSGQLLLAVAGLLFPSKTFSFPVTTFCAHLFHLNTLGK